MATSAAASSSTMPNPQLQQQQQQLSPQQTLSLLTPDQLRSMIQRARVLQKEGQTDTSSPELARIKSVLQYYQSYHRAQTYQQHAYLAHQRKHAAEYGGANLNGWGSKDHSLPNGTTLPAPVVPDPSLTAILAAPPPPEPEPSQPVIFTPTQLTTLRYQIHAYRLLSRGLPVPQHVLQAMQGEKRVKEEVARWEEEAGRGERTTMDRIVDSAVRMHVGALQQARAEEDVEMGPAAAEVDILGDSTIPFTHLRRPSHPSQPLAATKEQRLLVPATTPAQLDPHQLVSERERFVDARVAQRIRELEQLPVTIGDAGGPAFAASELDGDAAEEEGNGAKLRAMIELKALRLREKQRSLRQDVLATYTRSSFITTTATRAALTKLRHQTVRDARQTEQLERKQRDERIRRSKQKQLDYVQAVVAHGREMLGARKAAVQGSQRFGKMVGKFHADWEREAQKREERVARDRLKALKNDDEATYLRLIDSVKDTRITHLLRQTNQYLENLTQAVLAQQAAAGGTSAGTVWGEDEQPVSEATFGGSGFDTGEGTEEERRGTADYYAVAHRVQEKVEAQPGILVGGSLKDYQLKGLQWMVSLYNNKLNGILADEMGLGKTIQTISLIAFLIEKKRQPGPYLVIVPLSTLTNWTMEFQKWAPSVTTVVYKGAPPVRKQIASQLKPGSFQVLLTTYEYIIKDRSLLSRTKWMYMIIDEGHRMKNTQSRLSTTLTEYYQSKYRLILTGTPLQNNLPELWALLNFILPNIFNSADSFAEWFSKPFANTGTQEKLELNEEEALLVIRGLHKVLRPFLLRRLKKDVESELPDKTEKIIKCRMSALQSRMYEWMKAHKAVLCIPREKNDGRMMVNGGKGVNNTLMQLRKICNHPWVFGSVEEDTNPKRDLNENIYRVAGKFELIDRMLPKLFRMKHRVLMFFQMTEVMTIMTDYLKYRHYTYLRLDGTTKSDERAELLKQFNAPDSEYSIFLLSTRAGGLGLNLQSADTVILFDSDWNPHADLQAQDRAHRIGQKKAVSVFRLVTDKSVEEHMLARARDKLDMDGKVIQAGRFDQKTSAKEQEALLKALLEADAADDKQTSVKMSNRDLNDILARSEVEREEFEKMDREREREEKKAWKEAGMTGPRPERLMQDSELPPDYVHPKVPNDPVEDALENAGRGKRVKGPVHYTDGLTDEQFARAIENENVSLHEAIAKKWARKERREARKVAKAAGLLGTADNSARETPETGDDDVDMDSAEPGASRDTSLPLANGASSHATGAAPSPAPVAAKGKKRKREEEPPSLVETADGTEDEKPESKRPKKELKNGKEPAKRGRKTVLHPFKDEMKQVFLEIFNIVLAAIAPDGHQRCELFKELPDRNLYPDYYVLITQPICMSTIRKRTYAGYYKSVTKFRDEFHLMFNNARTYNHEESEVYNDAVELQKVFDDNLHRLTYGTEYPGAEGGKAQAVPEEEKAEPAPAQDEADVMAVDEPAPAPALPVEPPKKKLTIKVKLGGRTIG